jgi:hypothetical protein
MGIVLSALELGELRRARALDRGERVSFDPRLAHRLCSLGLLRPCSGQAVTLAKSRRAYELTEAGREVLGNA